MNTNRESVFSLLEDLGLWLHERTLIARSRARSSSLSLEISDPVNINVLFDGPVHIPIFVLKTVNELD